MLYKLILFLRSLGCKTNKPLKINPNEVINVKMNIVFMELWTDIFNSNLVYLSTYKYERQKLYPGVGYRFFTDYRDHKIWMLAESKRLIRIKHNKEILEKYRPKPKDPNKQY